MKKGGLEEFFFGGGGRMVAGQKGDYEHLLNLFFLFQKLIFSKYFNQL